MTAANDSKAAGPALPAKLTLEFSRAADYRRIDALLAPAALKDSDPNGYVMRRAAAYFRAAVNTGGAAMLTDERRGRIAAMTIAYRVNHARTANDNAPPPRRGHDITELGTSLSRLPGYNSARVVVAALTLREWWLNPPREAFIAEIKRTNAASLKTYVDGLHWTPLLDRARSAAYYAATDVTLVNDADKGSGKNLGDMTRAPSLWHVGGDAALAQSARILLAVMDAGGLTSKTTGHTIPVDCSALEHAGLTRARLKAIAAGQTSRRALGALPGWPPSPQY